MSKEKHLCKMVKKDILDDDFNTYIELIKSPKFVCKKCGRASKDKKYLCKPIKI